MAAIFSIFTNSYKPKNSHFDLCFFYAQFFATDLSLHLFATVSSLSKLGMVSKNDYLRQVSPKEDLNNNASLGQKPSPARVK